MVRKLESRAKRQSLKLNERKKGRKEEKGRKETRTFVFVSYCGGYSIGREVVIVNLKWAFEDLHF